MGFLWISKSPPTGIVCGTIKSNDKTEYPGISLVKFWTFSCNSVVLNPVNLYIPAPQAHRHLPTSEPPFFSVIHWPEVQKVQGSRDVSLLYACLKVSESCSFWNSNHYTVAFTSQTHSQIAAIWYLDWNCVQYSFDYPSHIWDIELVWTIDTYR